MSVEQLLQQTNAVEAISRELGVDATTARAGASALLPAILSGFQNPVASGGQQSAMSLGQGGGLGGLGGLIGTLSGLGGGGLLDNVTSPQPTDTGKGNEILGQIFGSKDGSRAVAAGAASESGVEPSLLKKMLPLLAMIAAGYVMKRAGGEGGLGGALGGMLGGREAETAGVSPSAQPTPQPSTGGGILDDIIGAAGNFLRR